MSQTKKNWRDIRESDKKLTGYTWVRQKTGGIYVSQTKKLTGYTSDKKLTGYTWVRQKNWRDIRQTKNCESDKKLTRYTWVRQKTDGIYVGQTKKWRYIRELDKKLTGYTWVRQKIDGMYVSQTKINIREKRSTTILSTKAKVLL